MDKNIIDTEVVKCSHCGANMRYSIKNKALKCDHCGNIENIDTGNNTVVRRELTNEILRNRPQWKESVVFKCVNCGAMVDMDKKEIVRKCPFCESSNILKTDEICGIQPDSVIPFTVTKQSAAERFKNWLRGKFYAPEKCKKAAAIENINDIYHPTWLFAADTQSYYDGMLGEDYTTTDSEGNKTTHTRWFRVTGNIGAIYRNILIPSGKIIPIHILNKLGAYPIESAKNYQQEYLAGRFAEHYSRDINVCFGDFERHIYSDLCMRIKHQYRADHVGKMHIKTNYNNKRFNYMLLPAYIANYKYKNNNYSFYINGATGRLCGHYPKSVWKILLTIFAPIAATVAIAIILTLLR